MRRLSLLGLSGLLFFVTLFCFSSTALSSDWTPDSFRGVKLGQDLKTIKGLVLVEAIDEGRIKLFYKKRESLRMGRVRLDSVRYLSYNDKIAQIDMFFIPNKENQVAALEELINSLGMWHEDKSKKGRDIYQWNYGENIVIRYAAIPQTGEGGVFAKYLPHTKEIDKYLDETEQE